MRLTREEEDANMYHLRGDADDHCEPHCEACSHDSRLESVQILENALFDLEFRPEGADGAWIDLELTVEALDIRNVLDLLQSRAV